MYQLPNFVIVGAAKAGSTSLYHYLSTHPQIFLPKEYKETRFFASEELKEVFEYKKTSVFDLDKFKSLYKGAESFKAVGDLGNVYLLFHEIAIRNIKGTLGEDVKIIMILRDPVERAFSAYQFACRSMYESKSFEYSLRHEDERIREFNLQPDIYHYKKYGLYYEPVKDYIDQFKNVKIILFEDLRDNPIAVMRDLFQFLEVNPDFKIEPKVYNEGGWVPVNIKVYNSLFHGKKLANKFKPKLEKIPFLFEMSKFFYGNLIKLRDKVVIRKKIQLNKVTEKELRNYFKKDILKLQDLIKRDLSSWL